MSWRCWRAQVASNAINAVTVYFYIINQDKPKVSLGNLEGCRGSRPSFSTIDNHGRWRSVGTRQIGRVSFDLII